MNKPSLICCVLCNSPADLLGTRNFGKYKVVSCNQCGEFAVSEAAEDRIRALSAEVKDRWRQMIRAAQEDEILLLTVAPVGSGGGLEEAVIPRRSIRL